MIEDEDDPQIVLAHQDLLRRLGTVLGDGRKELTKPFLEDMFKVIADHKSAWWIKGVRFPALVVLAVPGRGIVEFVRADLDIESIKTNIVNFVRKYPQLNMREVMEAFTRAYPDLKPDDVLSEEQKGQKATERLLERMTKIDEQAAKEAKEN